MAIGRIDVANGFTAGEKTLQRTVLHEYYFLRFYTFVVGWISSGERHAIGFTHSGIIHQGHPIRRYFSAELAGPNAFQYLGRIRPGRCERLAVETNRITERGSHHLSGSLLFKQNRTAIVVGRGRLDQRFCLAGDFGHFLLERGFVRELRW